MQDACALGLDVAVLSGTHVGNIDGQLRARPRGPGELHLLLNRGSEVFRAGTDGVELLERCTASAFPAATPRYSSPQPPVPRWRRSALSPPAFRPGCSRSAVGRPHSAQRWEEADVRIDGDPRLQLAVRLALYHLIGSAADSGEAPVGARGLSGRGYRGHVFWDSDVFVLPFLAATHPAAARAILEYRVRRLPAAQAAARAAGHAGARFAWESAASGEDVTPRAARNRAGEEVAIYTGQREEHIVADVAWAAGCYIDWTGDQTFREGPGRRLLVETARYWASRVERDGDGSAHIRGVIGPDEYHELVDDNAYTNVMARWSLRRASAETADGDLDRAERLAWLQLAEELVDGYRPDTGVYEQFAGFFELEPLVISEIGQQRPIAADLLLSPERAHRAQVVGGVHIAAMGSVWQALALGFTGARPRGDVLQLDPRLAAGWERLELRLRFRGAQLRVRVSEGAIEVSSDLPAQVSVAGAEPVTVGSRGHRWERL